MITANLFAREAEIGGYTESEAAALFATEAKFILRCQMASLIIDTFLAGILVVQVFTYFQYQKGDKWWTKAIVLWSCSWTFMITVYYWVYMSYLFVSNFGLWLPWLEVRWLAKMPTFDIITVIPIQCFFGYRAYLLTNRNKYLAVVLVLLLMAAAGGGIGVTIVFGQQATLLGATASGPTLITWTATTTAADVLIAVCILHGLLQSKTGWAHTDKLVARLCRMTFEAQLPPTFLALAYCIEWSLTPSSLLGAVFQCLQSKAYCVGLLFTLNSRIAFTIASNETKSSNAPQVFGLKSRNLANGIHVDVQTYIHDDNQYPTTDHKSHTKHNRGDSFSDHDTERGVTYEENHSQARLTDAVAV